MKKKSASKRDFSKFSKVQTHKRRTKDAARRELMKIIESTNTAYEGARINISHDGTRRARSSLSPHSDEVKVRGVFSASSREFGFVRREESPDDIFIPAGKTGGAIDGDLVEAIYHTYRDSYGTTRTEGRITKILEFGRTHIVGVVDFAYRGYGRKSTKIYILVPDDRKIGIKPVVADLGGARRGDKVLAKLSRTGGFTECFVEECFGPSESFGANYMSALAEFGIETDFSEEAILEAKRVSATPLTADGRTDLCDKIIFTIDGAGAKDLDDAVSLKKLKDGWLLGVHIADVSEYVREKTALDRTATSRGTSVYFTDKVVPMLPPELSNGACSLNAGEDKYALSAFIRLDGHGNIISTEIKPTVIRSCVRGVYSEVNSIFDSTATSEINGKYKRVKPTLMKMRELYLILKDKASRRGALELDGAEAEIVLDSDGCPTDIIRRERGDAERMIEQFMLTANEAVATLLHEKKIPCVYRVHDEPPLDKIENLIAYLSGIGFDTRGIRDGDGISLTGLSRVLDEARSRGVGAPVSYIALRSMAKAKYSETQSQHFGLGIKYYCHFTSPIRRLSDLATHRIIKKVLLGTSRSEQYASYARRAAAAATEGELRAIGAERKIEDMYKALYLSEHVGEVFIAVVSSITGFGMFCELENTCEGLVPLAESYGVLVFDEKNHTAKFGKKNYKLGDTVHVRVEECDVMRGKIRFSLAEENGDDL